MNQRESLEKSLIEVNQEISGLLLKRAEIENALMQGYATFEDKFKVWYNSKNKVHEPWIIREKDYPLLRKYFNEHYELDRHKTYDVLECLEDELWFLIDPEGYKSSVESDKSFAFSEEHIAEYTALAKEIMEKNIGSFTCDW